MNWSFLRTLSDRDWQIRQAINPLECHTSHEKTSLCCRPSLCEHDLQPQQLPSIQTQHQVCGSPPRRFCFPGCERRLGTEGYLQKQHALQVRPGLHFADWPKTRVKKHPCPICLQHQDKQAVTKHSIYLAYSIQLQNTTILSTSSRKHG